MSDSKQSIVNMEPLYSKINKPPKSSNTTSAAATSDVVVFEKHEMPITTRKRIPSKSKANVLVINVDNNNRTNVTKQNPTNIQKSVSGENIKM